MMNKNGEITVVDTSGNTFASDEVYKALAQSIPKDVLMRMLAEREHNDYLTLCSKYDLRRTITFDMAQKNIEFNFAEHKETHPIGNLLIHFLEADFTCFEKERQDTIEAYNSPETNFDLVGFPSSALPGFWLDTLKRWGITKEAFSKKSVINKLIKFNIHLHPYLTFYLTDKLMQEDGNLMLAKKCDLLSIQKQVGEMFAFCLDVDYDERLKGLTTLQRYYIYRNTKLDVPMPQFMSEMFMRPYAVPHQDRHIFRTQKTTDKAEILNLSLHELVTPNPLSDEQVEYAKRLDLTMLESYNAYDVQTVALLELFKMIQHNLFVKRCGYCGRYFVLKYSYENTYCDRIPDGEKSNCQTLGAMRDYQQEIKNSPAKLLHKRAYKKMNDYKNKRIVREEVYKQWIPVAKQKLNDCLDGKMTVSELEQWLSNNARGVRK